LKGLTLLVIARAAFWLPSGGLVAEGQWVVEITDFRRTIIVDIVDVVERNGASITTIARDAVTAFAGLAP